MTATTCPVILARELDWLQSVYLDQPALVLHSVARRISLQSFFFGLKLHLAATSEVLVSPPISHHSLYPHYEVFNHPELPKELSDLLLCRFEIKVSREQLALLHWLWQPLWIYLILAKAVRGNPICLAQLLAANRIITLDLFSGQLPIRNDPGLALNLASQLIGLSPLVLYFGLLLSYSLLFLL